MHQYQGSEKWLVFGVAMGVRSDGGNYGVEQSAQFVEEHSTVLLLTVNSMS